jgi:polysaccharide biosynthesis protein PslA
MSELTTGRFDLRKSSTRRHWRAIDSTLLTFEAYPVAPVDSAARRRAFRVKRAVDIVVSLIGLVLGFVPLVMIAAAVRLTSTGPVFFLQQRVGRGGRPFEIVKFRTVRVDETDPSGLTSIAPDDAGLTPIGRWLRTTGLDELPQLYNVLKGDMSLVGPRPMVEGMLACGRDYRELVPYYAFRHLMPPGLSGLAQVSGYRGMVVDEHSAARRVELDCIYIQQFSIRLDLAIIGRSVLQLAGNIVGIGPDTNQQTLEQWGQSKW